MNGCSPYSSKTTEQRLHEKHAELKESEQVWKQGKQRSTETCQNQIKHAFAVPHSMLYNF